MLNKSKTKIAIIGMGYVGLPLAVEFGNFFETVGFDNNPFRINELTKDIDSTLEVDSIELKSVKNLIYTSKTKDIENCNIFIISVPTPIDKQKNPDLKLFDFCI